MGGGSGSGAKQHVATAEQAVRRAKAEWTYAKKNPLGHRVRTVARSSLVTVDQVDRARTSEIAQAEVVKRRHSTAGRQQAATAGQFGPGGTLEAMLGQSKASTNRHRCRGRRGALDQPRGSKGVSD